MKDSILSQLLELQQVAAAPSGKSQRPTVYLGNTYIDNLAHKILHTFEKMDAINPTFERYKLNMPMPCGPVSVPESTGARLWVPKVQK